MTATPVAVGPRRSTRTGRQWRSAAACAASTVNPAWFDETAPAEQQSRAKLVCRTCPVVAECFLEAEQSQSLGRYRRATGVWGGLVITEAAPIS